MREFFHRYCILLKEFEVSSTILILPLYGDLLFFKSHLNLPLTIDFARARSYEDFRWNHF